MASADDDIDIPPMPALHPIGGNGCRVSGDEFPRIFLGQNSPPGAAAGVEDTQPIRRIHVHSDEPSAMSGMTTPNPQHSHRVSGQQEAKQYGVPRQIL